MPRWLKKLINMLFGFQGTLIYCPKCKSLHVGFGETTKLGNIETYNVNCKDCGATGFITENWS